MKCNFDCMKSTFATLGNYNKSIEKISLLRYYQNAVFFKLHTGYKHCIELTFSTTLGWTHALIPAE